MESGKDPKKQIEELVEKVKDKFGLGPKNIIGIDIGASAVKIAELRKGKKGKFKLINFSMHELPEGALIESEVQLDEEVIRVLEEAFVEKSFTTKYVCLGLSGPGTVARRLQLAGGNEDDIDDQVMWEAEQYIPFDIDDSAISYHVIGENEGGGVDVVVAAAKNDTLLEFSDIVVSAGLRAKIVDLNQIAVINLLENSIGDEINENNSSWLVLDIGAQKTTFIIYKNGMILFSKDINVGGLLITEEIQRQMGVNYKEAEDLKIVGDGKGNLAEEILEIIDDVAENFFTEIKKTLDFYISSSSDESFSGCIVTGGSSQIPGLLDGLEALTGFKVKILNPFDNIEIADTSLSDDQISEIAYRGATVLGLAMREIEK